MRFAFTDQQLELRVAVRQALGRLCTVDDLRGTGGAPARSAERWGALASMGAPGLLVGEEHGGLGLGDVDLVGVLEECGRVALPEPLAESAAVAAPILARAGELAGAGSAAAKAAATLLPGLAAGELVTTVGGADLAPWGAPEPVTSTEPAPDVTQGTVVTSRVNGATAADLYLLAWEVPGSGWQLHAVGAGSVEATATPSVDPTRDLGRVEWTPWPHTMIASGGHAADLVDEIVDRSALAAAAQLLGLADRMVSDSAAYAVERHQFGRPIGSFQAVKHHLADARVRLEFARPAVYRAADSVARCLPGRSEHVSMAKALASDAADLAARMALQVHGAVGYTWECHLHYFMKRAWALSAAWGAAPVHRRRVLAAAVERQVGRHGEQRTHRQGAA
ncbi:MAG: acyl-CoA dehydrogenase family protein [Acidimicrobiales bacterium]